MDAKKLNFPYLETFLELLLVLVIATVVTSLIILFSQSTAILDLPLLFVMVGVILLYILYRIIRFLIVPNPVLRVEDEGIRVYQTKRRHRIYLYQEMQSIGRLDYRNLFYLKKAMFVLKFKNGKKVSFTTIKNTVEINNYAWDKFMAYIAKNRDTYYQEK